MNFPVFFRAEPIGQAWASVDVYNPLLFLSANIGNIPNLSFPVTLVEATTDTVLLVLKVLILAQNA